MCNNAHSTRFWLKLGGLEFNILNSLVLIVCIFLGSVCVCVCVCKNNTCLNGLAVSMGMLSL